MSIPEQHAFGPFNQAGKNKELPQQQQQQEQQQQEAASPAAPQLQQG